MIWPRKGEQLKEKSPEALYEYLILASCRAPRVPGCCRRYIKTPEKPQNYL